MSDQQAIDDHFRELTHEHEHHYVFLRQETIQRPTYAAGYKRVVRVTQDVFYCSGCLDYRRESVKTDTLDGTATEFILTG